MIKAYVNYWKGFINFGGRTTVGGYWWAFLANIIVTTILGVILPSASLIWSAVNLLPGLAIFFRRLRDAGKTWFNIFWLLVPVLGWILIILFLIKPSK